MKFKTLMIIKALVCLGFGPALVLIPDMILPLFGVEFCSGANLTAHEYGASMVGNLILAWLYRDIPPFQCPEGDNLGPVSV